MCALQYVRYMIRRISALVPISTLTWKLRLFTNTSTFVLPLRSLPLSYMHAAHGPPWHSLDSKAAHA